MTEEGVSHADLDAAAEEVDQPAAEIPAAEPEPEPVAEEEVKPEAQVAEPEGEPEPEVPAEPEDNAERSRLGRKVAALETQLQTALQALQEQAKPPADPVDPDDLVTVGKLDEYLGQAERRKQAVVKQYNAASQQELLKYGKQYKDEDWLEIVKMAESNWEYATRNPAVDTRLNFREAERKFLQGKIKKGKTPVNPLEKNKDQNPTNLGGESGAELAPPKEQAKPQLDKYAQDLVNRTGMSDESVDDALNNSPSHLGGEWNRKFGKT